VRNFVLQPKDEIVQVNGIPVTAETVGDALKGSDVPGTRACIKVKLYGKRPIKETYTSEKRLIEEMNTAGNTDDVVKGSDVLGTCACIKVKMKM